MRLAALALLVLATVVVAEEPPVDESKPAIVELGEQRYQVGRVIIDKGKQSFTVPGRVIHVIGAMEYLAVTEGGMKEYESLLELGATATEFQLACILVGLDDSKSVKPRYQFDERDAEGQGVDIRISWQPEQGEAMRIKAASAFLDGDEPFDNHDWVYIGSNTQPDGQFSAELFGTLIGFVHDPDAIIEHRRGAGIGAYGSIIVNAELLPPEGAPVSVSVSVIKGGEERATESTGE